MPSLKDLRNRIDSVKSTRKITQAMKMVAASKLKKAQILAERGRDYSQGLKDIVEGLVDSDNTFEHPMLAKLTEKNTLILVVSSDRGLCGGLNTNIIKKVKTLISIFEREQRKVTLLCIGKKGYDSLYNQYSKFFDYRHKLILVNDMSYDKTKTLSEEIMADFSEKNFDSCYLLYSFFKSVISQEVVDEKLIPLEKKENKSPDKEVLKNLTAMEYEPDEEEVLSKILPKNFTVQFYKAILESKASEQGARMTAMDNATRNAGEMIDKLTIEFNRSRQAVITNELIEIISGAEAL